MHGFPKIRKGITGFLRKCTENVKWSLQKFGIAKAEVRIL